MHTLSQDQVGWIIRKKEEGRLTNREIAAAQGISRGRVLQLYREYRRGGSIPTLRRPGRPRSPPLSEEERELIFDTYKAFRMGACYMQKILLHYVISINRNRIHQLLREQGISLEEPRKQRRKWIRYEREHSNDPWHTDWHQIKDPRWKGLWPITYEDDSSRSIVGHGVYPTLTSEYSVDVLKKGIEKYGRSEQMLSDHGSTFSAIEADERKKGLTVFEKLLLKEKITFIVGRVNHPQTNGKIKFFDIFEKKVKFFNSVNEFMNWYNFIRPHGAFDIGKLETPAVIYYQRLPKKEIMIDGPIIP